MFDLRIHETFYDKRSSRKCIGTRYNEREIINTVIDKCCKIYFYSFSCMYNCQCLVRLLVEVHNGDMVFHQMNLIFVSIEKIHGNPAYADVIGGNEEKKFRIFYFFILMFFLPNVCLFRHANTQAKRANVLCQKNRYLFLFLSLIFVVRFFFIDFSDCFFPLFKKRKKQKFFLEVE